MSERTLDEVDPGHGDDSSHRSSIGIHIDDSSGGRDGGGRDGGGRDGGGRDGDWRDGGGSGMVVVVDH